MPDSMEALRRRIDIASGRHPPDLVLANGRIVNVLSCEIHEGDIALAGDRIAGIGRYDGPKRVDLGGGFVCPGLFDAHVHIESSMLDVAEFARTVCACGTTGIAADPHEFANVAGLAGIRHVLDGAEGLPLDVFVMLSSCVPASQWESAGATLAANDLARLMSHPRVLGLAEMMNYPGVINADPAVLEKVLLAAERVVDGHAPAVTGQSLMAYAAAGIGSDHECIRAEEAAEKLRAGFFIMVREGSQTRNLEALLPVITPHTCERFMFCTDDKDVRDILAEGHIDFMVRKAIGLGLDPMLAVRCATINPARYFGLRTRGAIAPGYRADLVVVDDLASFRPRQVYHGGQLVAQDGACTAEMTHVGAASALRNSVRIAPISEDDLRIPWPGSGPPPHIHLIEVLDNRIDTERSTEPARVESGALATDAARDIAKLVVVERHRASGRVCKAFARGFRLRGGALAGSVAHDAHNLVAVGVNDRDITVALRRVAELGGGLVAVNDGRVLAELALPIAGLVSDRPARETADRLSALTAAARGLGCTLAQPYMCLAFLSLSVIGKLKLTDRGLIDVERFEPISLVAG